MRDCVENSASLARSQWRYENRLPCSTGRLKSTPRHKNVNYDFVARTFFSHIQNSPAGN